MGVLRPVGLDAMLSLQAAACVSDAALDHALLRIGILAPADLDEIKHLVSRPGISLRPTCNSHGHRIVEVRSGGQLVAEIHHDGSVVDSVAA